MASSSSDPMAKYALSKLLQMGIAAKYQNEFEMLIPRIPQSLLIPFYILGLKLHLQRELNLVSRSTTLGNVFSLACIIEAHFEDTNNQVVDNNGRDKKDHNKNAKQEVKKADDQELKNVKDEECKNVKDQQVSEKTINETADTITSLQSKVASLDAKGSLDANERSKKIIHGLSPMRPQRLESWQRFMVFGYHHGSQLVWLFSALCEEPFKRIPVYSRKNGIFKSREFSRHHLEDQGGCEGVGNDTPMVRNYYNLLDFEIGFCDKFSEDSTARYLWKVCSDYGTVVDVVIPFKRSKSGKRFAFVRFIKIASLWGEYVEWEDADPKSLSCKHLYLKTDMKVIINERQKVIIQGKVYWIRVKELDAWFLNFQEDDQDDLSFDGESQEGDVANKADNNESHVDRVSESSFMHENDTAHKDVNSCKKGEVGSHSEDPFNIYGILNGQKNNVCNSCSDEPKFPPGFTPDNNDQEKNVEENIKILLNAKRRWIKELCEKHRINFASIQETKAESISLHTIKDLWGNQMFDHVVGSLVACSGGYAFTWAHKSASKMSKLDRYLISEEVDKLIDQGKSNDEILINHVLNDLHELNNRNAMVISQNAKIRLSIEGDENSKYFHDQVQDLERTVTYEEVKKAVWDCGTNKSPGPDGFSFEFYRLKINLHKSKLMGIGVSSNVVAAATSLIGCSILTAPFNYLVVKLKLLSISGRLSLLKSVLTPIPLYHMSIFKVPIGVLNHLESIRRNFFYGVDGSDRKRAWIGWNMVLTSKKMGLIPRISPWQDVILAIHSLQSKGEVPTRWLRVVPIKVNVHAWRVCLDKLPTRANLSLRGMDIPLIACLLCNTAVESFSHIFFPCPLARQVWRNFLIWWELEDVAFNSYNEWLIWIVNIRLHKQLKVFLEGLKINLHKSKLMEIGVTSNVVAVAASLIGCSILTDPFNYLGVKKIFMARRNLALHSLQSKGEVALKVLYKRLYALEMCKSISVAEKIGHPSLSQSFRRMPRGGVDQENYGLLSSKVADLVLPNISDRWC
nr:RNA-directed DNA polymerase, eukaryota [Tanacetum cinerariifolium]